MTFKERQLNSMTFQALKMKFLNSKTFQVFHDLYEPCSFSQLILYGNTKRSVGKFVCGYWAWEMVKYKHGLIFNLILLTTTTGNV